MTATSGTATAVLPSPGLLVDMVRIRGFRSLVDVEIRLEAHTTYLVGENNSGKSSVLLAIATACGHRRPIDEDLYRGSEGAGGSDAYIDLLIRSTGDEFPEGVTQRLAVESGPGPGPGEWTGIRSSLKASSEGSYLPLRRTFLRWDSGSGEWVDSGSGVPERVLELLTAQLLEASRDLTTDLANRSSHWGRVLADLGIAGADRDTLEQEMEALADHLQDASPVVDALQERLSKVAQASQGSTASNSEPSPPNSRTSRDQ